MQILLRAGIPQETIEHAQKFAELIASRSGVDPKDKKAYIYAVLMHHFRKPNPYRVDEKGLPILNNGRIQCCTPRELRDKYG